MSTRPPVLARRTQRPVPLRSYASRARLRGERVLLVRPTREDAGPLLALTLSNKDFYRPWVVPPYNARSFQQYLERIEAGRDVGFLVVDREQRQLQGVVNLNEVTRRGMDTASLGYYGRSEGQGTGLIREAVALVLGHAFGELELHRVEANIQPDNARSLALVSALGFRREGFSPRFMRIDGAWRDHERWALLTEDWRAGRG
ncbi:MAG: GNAT family protein [Sneathiellaceae bacterium]